MGSVGRPASRRAAGMWCSPLSVHGLVHELDLACHTLCPLVYNALTPETLTALLCAYAWLCSYHLAIAWLCSYHLAWYIYFAFVDVA